MKRTFNIILLAMMFSLLVSAVGLPPLSAQAAALTWENVGAPGFSAGAATYTSLALDGNTPYVAYRDAANGLKVSVTQFDGASWVNVGAPGFSAGSATYISLALDGNTPYVAYRDAANSSKVSVMTFDGTNWVNVGAPGFSAGAAVYISLALDGNTPYVAYRDGGTFNRASVMKFDGTSWVNVGVAGFSAGGAAYTSLALDVNTPYVAYQDAANSSKVSVMKFDGTSWVNVGAPGFSAGSATYTSLALDGNTPYVAYQDASNSSKVSVMTLDGTSWVNVGAAGFSAGPATYISLALDGNTPYVAYQDAGNSSKATVMTFDGTNWVNVGAPGFSTGPVTYTSLALNGNTTYVAYQDDSVHSYKASVMKFAQDITAPALESFTLLTPATSPTNADSLVFLVTFSEEVENVDAFDFDVTGTDAGISSVDTFDGGLTYEITISGGNLAALNGTVGLDLVVTQDITDVVGNPLPNGEPTIDDSYVVDNTAPAAPVVETPSIITNDATPIISGTAEVGSWINAWYFDDFDNPVLICEDILVDGLGDWSCVSSVTLPEREIALAVNATDAAGNTSDDTYHYFIIDLTAPAAPVVTAPPAFINDATPTISGTAESDSLINVWYLDDLGDPIQICEDILVDGLGDWSCVSSEILPERAIEMSVNATDNAGNTSGYTAHPFTVDLTAPAAPVVTAPPAFTDDTTPTISGTAEAGSLINVWYFDDLGAPIQICSDVLADGLGDWSCVSSEILPGREIELAVNATDAAGNTSLDASHFFTVDLTAPAAPVVTAPPAFTDDTTPTISGTAEAGSLINVWYFDDLGDPIQICSDVLADGLGDWSCVSSEILPEREIELAVNATDAVGNTSLDTSHFFTVDLTAPAAPVVTAPPAFTDDTTPTISGTAEAGSLINVWYFDDLGDPIQICSDVLADGLGDWSCVSSEILPGREIELAVNATDAAGNTSLDASHFFTVQTPGTWYVYGGGNYIFGTNSDTPVVADYDGDGKADIAIFRPSNNTWYVYGVGNFLFGDVGDIPVVADYNGDKKADIAVFRPSNNTWYVYGVGNFLFGDVGDIPVVADYNGDGKADIAVFRPSNHTWYVYGVGNYLFGDVGDIPVVGDYNGDKKADIAVFRPADNTWYVYGIGNYLFGDLGDVPVVADYNGDGKADIAVFRP